MGIIKLIRNWLSGKRTVKRKIKAYRRDGVKVKAHQRTMTVKALPGENWWGYLQRTGDSAGAERVRQRHRAIDKQIQDSTDFVSGKSRKRDTWTQADEAELQRLNDAVYWAVRVDDSDSDEYVDRVEAAADGAERRIAQLEQKKARRYQPQQRGFLPMEETQVEAANRGNAAYIDYERRQWQKDQDRLKAFLGFYEETGNKKMAASVRARLGKTYR